MYIIICRVFYYNKISINNILFTYNTFTSVKIYKIVKLFLI